jgi:hypothetical protein
MSRPNHTSQIITALSIPGYDVLEVTIVKNDNSGYRRYLALIMPVLIFLVASELVCRIAGVAPLRRSSLIDAQTFDRSFFRKDGILGYANTPGRFVIAKTEGHYQFTITHLADSLRITRPLDTYNHPRPFKGAIWIFGCSLTHGWSLDDTQTYSWLLQERFPDFDVVNFGVGGYGTVHSLLQLKEAVKSRRPPTIVILAYANFHDERNVMSRNWRLLVAPWNGVSEIEYPFARFDDRGQLKIGKIRVDQVPALIEHSALVRLIEINRGILEDRQLRAHEVSEALIAEMNQLTSAAGGRFVLANIFGDNSILKFAAKQSIPGVDIAVDLRIKENNNLPYDLHPSAIANQKYAAKLGDFVARYLSSPPDLPPRP